MVNPNSPVSAIVTPVALPPQAVQQVNAARSSDLANDLRTIAATFRALGVTPGKVKALWVDLRQHDWAFRSGRIYHEDCGRTGTLATWLDCAKDEGEFAVIAADGVPCAVVEWLPNYAERVVIAVTDSLIFTGD